jgi:hypothetical protein
MMHQQYIAGVIYETYLLTNVFISVTKIFLLYFWNPNKVNLNKIFVCVWPIWYDNIYMFLYIHCWLAGFNNISVISWQSVLSVEETRVPGENHPSVTSHWQTLSHNVVFSTSPWTGFEPTTLVVIGTDCTGSVYPTTIRSRRFLHCWKQKLIEKWTSGELFWPVFQWLQINFIYIDIVRILCLSCNVKNSKTTTTLSEKNNIKHLSSCFNGVFFHVCYHCPI